MGVAEARAIIDELAAAALDRAALVTEHEQTDQAALARIMTRLITGRARITGRWT